MNAGMKTERRFTKYGPEDKTQRSGDRLKSDNTVSLYLGAMISWSKYKKKSIERYLCKNKKTNLFIKADLSQQYSQDLDSFHWHIYTPYML